MIKSELEIDVRYYETDQMGIVHHSNYIRYFECGRSDMMAKAGIPIDKIEAAGVVLPVISVVQVQDAGKDGRPHQGGDHDR